jgi:hypothetical protein
LQQPIAARSAATGCCAGGKQSADGHLIDRLRL